MSRKFLTPVNIPALATAPTLPTIVAGDLYFNTVSLTLYVWTGTAWAESSGSGGATLTVTAAGGVFIVDGVSKPVLNFTRGSRYTININASGHPFYFQTSGLTYNAQNVYTTGVTGSGTAVGTIIFQVPYNAPNELTYVCQNHANMGNIISVSNAWESEGGGVLVSASEPTLNLTEGLLWFDTTTDALLVYYDGEFVEVSGGGGASNMSDLTSSWFLGV